MLKNIPDNGFAVEKARMILKAAQDLHSEKNFQISASIGINIFNGTEKNYAKIFESADKSVYLVKMQGRNGFSINEAEKQTL